MCANATADPKTGGYAALKEDTWWQCGLFRLPDLDQHKGYQKGTRECKQCNDTLIAPLEAVSFIESGYGGRFNSEHGLSTYSICEASPL